MSNHSTTNGSNVPTTHRRRRILAAIAIVSAAVASVGTLAGDSPDTADTTVMSLGSTWS